MKDNVIPFEPCSDKDEPSEEDFARIHNKLLGEMGNEGFYIFDPYLKNGKDISMLLFFKTMELAFFFKELMRAIKPRLYNKWLRHTHEQNEEDGTSYVAFITDWDELISVVSGIVGANWGALENSKERRSVYPHQWSHEDADGNRMVMVEPDRRIVGVKR